MFTFLLITQTGAVGVTSEGLEDYPAAHETGEQNQQRVHTQWRHHTAPCRPRSAAGLFVQHCNTGTWYYVKSNNDNDNNNEEL